LHFPQEQLDAPVIEIHQILEHEHLVLDLLCEIRIDFAQVRGDGRFHRRAQVVEDFRRGIQSLLREVQSESLIIALKGANAELRDKVFRNMSQRAAEMLRDDLESKGPVRLSEVENEQREILRVVRRLAEEGQIVLGGKGEEGLVE